MKNYGFIGLSVLLVASLIGAVFSFTTPDQTTISQPTKVLDYQQEGVFDYTVISRPSFFYGSTPAVTPDPSPQIPVKSIEAVVLNYSYHPAPGDTGETAEINAILENPGNWKKTINLLPGRNLEPDLFIPVDINYFQSLADTIEKEIGIASSAHNLTIQAVVSRGNSLEFKQDLPIKMTKTYIKIGDNLTSSNKGRAGKFDYHVKLGENTLFGPVTLTSPAAMDNPQEIVLGPGATIFTKFIDSMKVNYSYRLTSAKPIRQLQEEVTIEAVLENPETWTKTYTLVAPTKKDGQFNLTFPLDINQFNTIFDTIQQETGVQASKENLTLKATVHTQAQTSAGPIDQNYTQSMQTNLRSGLLSWSGDMKKSAPGSITVPQLVTIPTQMLGLPVLWIRIVSVALLIILLAIFGYYLTHKSKAGVPALAEIKARQISQKYKELIVEVNERPEFKPGQTTMPLDSLQDLIKVAQGLLKPIHHIAENGTHVYWINDDSTRYQFLLISGKTERDIKAIVSERTSQPPPN